MFVILLFHNTREGKKPNTESTTSVTMTWTTSSHESKCLANCRPLHYLNFEIHYCDWQIDSCVFSALKRCVKYNVMSLTSSFHYILYCAGAFPNVVPVARGDC